MIFSTTGIERRLQAGVLGAMLLGVLSPAPAQQYESEARVLSREEASQPEQEFDAEKALKQAQGDPYAQAMILRELAGQAAQAGDEAAAARFLRQALDKNALSDIASQQMQKELAVLLAEQEDYGAVVRELAPLLRNEKDPPAELRLVLGGAYAQLERYREAWPLVDSAIEDTRNPPHDWYALGAAVAAGLKLWEPAIGHIEAALRLEPGKLDYWQQLANIHIQRQDPVGALAALDLAFRLGLLEGGQDRMRFAQLFFANGVPFEAASLLQEGLESGALERRPGRLEMLAAAWVAAKESLLAIPALQDAAEATGRAELYLQLGQLEFDRGNWDGAARALQTALARGAGRQQAAAQMMLGVARYQLNDFDASRRAFQAAAEFRDQRDSARQWLAYIDSGLARENAIRMAALAPQDDGRASGRFGGERVTVSAGGSTPRSGERFTPVGAERGSALDGRIPAWTGGLGPDDLPAGHQRGERLQDPYPDDEPEFVITADNWQEHADELSLGHRALFEAYPDYRMPVYRSRRSVSYPQAIYEATQANRGRAKLLGSDALAGARLGFPFPSPQSGVEIMWNHRTRYRGNTVEAHTRQALVQPDGRQSERFRQTERVLYRYANIENPADLTQENILLYYLTRFSSDTGDSFLALVHESANSLEKSRGIWVMPSGLSKLFRVPPVGYDNPFPGSGGLMFVDMLDMYNGAFDRYDWKLMGKREVLLPYNAYRLNDGRVSNDELLTPRFMNPARTRYELHRVWLIEAIERGGKKHSFGARRFYIDEDSWNIVLVENFDRSGELWRFQEGHLLPFYDVQWTNAMPVVTYDLKDGRYFANRLTNEDPWVQQNVDDMNPGDFRPGTVRGRYSR